MYPNNNLDIIQVFGSSYNLKKEMILSHYKTGVMLWILKEFGHIEDINCIKEFKNIKELDSSE